MRLPPLLLLFPLLPVLFEAAPGITDPRAFGLDVFEDELERGVEEGVRGVVGAR